MERNKIRILIAKVGLDGHDRGAKYIAQALRDKGFEVIYTGIRKTPEEVANIAIQEDVQFIGLSSLSGAHTQLFPKVVDLLKEKGAEGIIVFGGGVIPCDDIEYLKSRGVKELFTPGAMSCDIEKFILSNV